MTSSKVCRFYQRDGSCRFGTNCRFSHSVAPKQQQKRNNNNNNFDSDQKDSEHTPQKKKKRKSRNYEASHLEHKSALCIIPPNDIWPAIQEIRSVHDAAFNRWPPHINILYPFLKDNFFNAESSVIAEALSDIQPFEMELKRFNYFDKKSQSTLYVFLQPSPANAIGELQKIYDNLTELYPACDTAKSRGGFHGHLTCGQFASAGVRNTVTKMNGEWETLRFTCDAVQLISRVGNTKPFEVRHEIVLGGN